MTTALVVALLLAGLAGYAFLDGSVTLPQSPPASPTEPGTPTVPIEPGTSTAVAVAVASPAEATPLPTAPPVPTAAAVATVPPVATAVPTVAPPPPTLPPTVEAPPTDLPATATVPPTSVPTPAALFRAGDHALVTPGHVTGAQVYALTVHAAPGLNTARIGGARVDIQVVVRDGPRDADGITWWQITGWDRAGTAGWVSGFNLAPITP
jgi:hypothetical protein